MDKNELDKHYWEGNFILTDKEYDQKYGDISYEILQSENLIKHKIPILSLRKAYDLETLKKLFHYDLSNIIVQPKFDGMAICIYYENSIPKIVATKGNSIYGEILNINENFPKIDYLTNHLLLGEAIVKNNIKIDTLPRAYVIGKLKSKFVNLENISFVFYELIDLNTLESNINLLLQLPLEISPYENYNENLNLDLLFENYSKIYPIDGLVFRKKYIKNDFENPNYKFAYKNEKLFQSKEAKVKNIIWELSKNGNYIPTIEIEPIILENTKITKVLANNFMFVIHNQIGKNSIVLISKRGHIIPYISDIITKSNNVEYPKKCYYCNYDLIQKGVHLYCPNNYCNGKSFKKYFLFLKTLNVKPFGIALYKSIYDPNFNYYDYLFIDKKNLNIYSKNYEKFCNSLKQNRKKLNLPLLFTAFQIEGCSYKYFENLFSKYSLDYVLENSNQFHINLKEFIESNKDQILLILKELEILYNIGGK